MKVRDVMTENVYSLQFDKKTIIAQDIMNWASVRHVPIVDGGNRVLGIVTHRDLLHASISRISTTVAECEKTQHLSQIPIDQLMRTEVETIGPDASVQEAARIMRTRKFGCLPVVDQAGRLVGIISEYDLLGVVERATALA